VVALVTVFNRQGVVAAAFFGAIRMVPAVISGMLAGTLPKLWRGVSPWCSSCEFGDIQKMIDFAAMTSPLKRGITPEEVANAAVFLCSPLASMVTGTTLYVDSGYHAMGM
jgi:enoyl-[acyl-carrier protein] reductase I